MTLSGKILFGIGGVTLIGVIGFALYFASFWGLLGGWLIPRGTDKAKLESLQAVRAAIHIGMTGDEAKTAAKSSRGVVFESSISRDRWFGQTVDPKNFVLGVVFKRTSWLGPVATNCTLEITIHDGLVADIKSFHTTSAP
jgi:hypothetical protein